MNFFESIIASKQKLFIGFAVLVSFALGFTAASLRLQQTAVQASSQPKEAIAQDNNTPITPYNQQKQTKPTPVADSACPVKGKVAKDGVKNYYVPGDTSYARLKADQCFNNESDAQLAGFTKYASKKAKTTQ